MRWRRNLPLRKGGLVADASGARYWIHRAGTNSYRLTYRIPGSDAIWHHDVLFSRQMHAKGCAERIEKGRDAA